MSIADLILEAAQELHFEFTQHEWEKALLEGWRKDLSMGSVLVMASGFGADKKISISEWDLLIARAGELKPSLSAFSSLRNRARVWIAQNARLSNDALYDGDYEKAVRLFKKGGRAANGRKKNIREAKAEIKNDAKGVLVIKVRERDTRTSWSTCK